PEPVNAMCQSALSRPRTKTSRRPGAHEETSGSPISAPPSGYHPDQPPLTNALPHNPLSPPRANTSMRFGLDATAVGLDVMEPPSVSQGVQLVPSPVARCHRAPSNPRAKTSM